MPEYKPTEVDSWSEEGFNEIKRVEHSCGCRIDCEEIDKTITYEYQGRTVIRKVNAPFHQLARWFPENIIDMDYRDY